MKLFKGNEDDCICDRPAPYYKHTPYCDAYRLSEFLKKVNAVLFPPSTRGKTKSNKPTQKGNV